MHFQHRVYSLAYLCNRAHISRHPQPDMYTSRMTPEYQTPDRRHTLAPRNLFQTRQVIKPKMCNLNIVPFKGGRLFVPTKKPYVIRRNGQSCLCFTHSNGKLVGFPIEDGVEIKVLKGDRLFAVDDGKEVFLVYDRETNSICLQRKLRCQRKLF